VIRSFKYLLRPTKAQTLVLSEWLQKTREVYNAGLQERRDAWKKQKISVSLYDQYKQLSPLRKERLDLANIPVWVLRGPLARLDKAFAGFFRRCKSGDKPGFPRFKGRYRWSSILIDDLQKGNPIVAGGKRVSIPKLGKVKLKLHRPLEGTPKALRLTLDCRGRWFVTFACVDVPQKLLPPSTKGIGIDLGLTNFVTTSEGEVFDSPRALKTARLKLERAQRKVSRRKRGSGRRRTAICQLARSHEKVANIRRENHIFVANSLVCRFGTIYVENLNIKNMTKNHKLARAISDASWGLQLHWLHVKAESAGRLVQAVDPRGSSQTCSCCGSVVPKTLGVRVHRCSCGLVICRDHNAALNILGRGRRLQGAVPLVKGRQRSAKYTEQAYGL
jgi:putative transposase